MPNKTKALTLYPAIDLKGGRCVRLSQGDFDKATIYNDDPADQAKIFVSQGFSWIHVVDLDGSVEGKAVNGDAVSAILKTAPVPVQLGGGVRNMAAVEHWLEAGISRVILGTAAVRDPAFVIEAAAAYPEQIAVGLDVRDGKVAVQGWLEDSGLSALEVARRFEDAGVGGAGGHRHQPRRHAQGRQRRGVRPSGGCGLDPGDRGGGHDHPRRHRGSEAPQGRSYRRRRTRQVALRRHHQAERGSSCGESGLRC